MQRIKALLAAFLAVLWLGQVAFASQLMLTGMGLGGAAVASGSVIQSIQSGTITISAASLTGTATITAVVTANSMLVFGGVTTTNASAAQSQRWGSRLDLTNTTTVTATRQDSNDAVTVAFTVIEFSSGVNSIQAGTVSMTVAQGSNTATISAVGANAFVLWEGASTAIAAGTYADVLSSVQLTNSTTVTVRGSVGATTTVGYMVVDLTSTIINSVQPVASADSSANTSWTATITSVTAGNTLLFFNGEVTTLGGVNAANAMTQELTNGTTITFTRQGTNAVARTAYLTAVEFKSGVLNGSVQRGTIALAAATSNTATITSVTTAKSFVNWGVLRGGNSSANALLDRMTLTNATTVTENINTSGTITGAYEVLQFL